MEFDRSKPCHYCGMLASGVDHIPPISVRIALAESGIEGQWPIKDVPCCVECNSAIGASAPFSLGDRRKIVKAFLRRKYRQCLKTPHWEEAEIACLGYGLQLLVRKNLAMRDTIRMRLAY